jgi:metal-sulfur cluster biosynthetic enzyme
MSVEARLWEALREVEDPEIPISVVGMGLIVSLAYDAGARRCAIDLTFTAMGCPAMDFIQDDIRERLLQEPDVDEVRIEIVWDALAHPRGVARDHAQAGDRRMRRDEDVWEVFARKAYDEPLHHVGVVTERDEDLALVCARSIYDEQPWIEMIIVPRSAIREAISA